MRAAAALAAGMMTVRRWWCAAATIFWAIPPTALDAAVQRDLAGHREAWADRQLERGGHHRGHECHAG
jgi:hypothetical protein